MCFILRFPGSYLRDKSKVWHSVCRSFKILESRNRVIKIIEKESDADPKRTPEQLHDGVLQRKACYNLNLCADKGGHIRLSLALLTEV
jgi:hypothetical protein